MTTPPATPQSKREEKDRFAALKNFGTTKERDYLIENLSMLLASGMPVTVALQSINKELKSKRIKELIARILSDIDGGSTLWQALDRSSLFDKHVIALIRVGEESGKLSENLKTVLAQQQKDRMLKSKIRSAMIYPVIVFSLTLVVAIGSAWFVLPRLAAVFSDLNVQLPWSTRMIIAAGSFLQVYGYLVIPGLILCIIVLLLLLFVVPPTKRFAQSFIFLHIPVIKKIVQEIELARLGFVLGSLLDSGIPVVDSLRIASEVTDFYPYKKLFEQLEQSIEEGNSFEKSFSQIKHLSVLIPTTTQQLIITAEQSGRLPETFYNIGENYTFKTETTTRDLSSILEPALLIFVSIGVFILAIGIISPIYNLIGGINSQTYNQSGGSQIAPQDSPPPTPIESGPTPTISLTPSPSP